MDDDFYKDIEELDEDEGEEIEEMSEEGEVEDEQQQAIGQFKREFKNESKEISILFNNPEFQKHMNVVGDYISKQINKPIEIFDAEYQLIIKSNQYSAILDREIVSVHNFVKDLYFKRFSELESIVINSIEFVKCVKLIKNEQDINKIDLSQIITNHQIVAVKVAASSTTGKPLNQEELQRVLKACDLVLDLYEAQRKLLRYIETRMKYLAPNLSALVGTSCSSQLISAAGGIEGLARMPACNIQVMGSKKQSLLGFSKQGKGLHRGFFGSLDFVLKAPAEYQTRLVRMLSTNVAKCSRIDLLRTSRDGSAGQKIKEQMLQRFDKIQENKQAKTMKPLPIPDEKRKPNRGGKKYRKMKERYATTEVRQNMNRLKFGTDAEEEFRDTGKGYGMLSKAQGSGKIKMNINKNQKLGMSKATAKRLVPFQSSADTGVANGLASSLAFTPIQGMELINPLLLNKQEKRPDNYFNKESGFRTVIQDRMKENIKFDKQ